MTSIIQVGQYQLKGGVNEVTCKRSVKEIVDTCTLKIPALGRVNDDDDLPANSIATSTLWQEGDKVNVQLGYNDDNRQEFLGFVRRVTPSIPGADRVRRLCLAAPEKATGTVVEKREASRLFKRWWWQVRILS